MNLQRHISIKRKGNSRGGRLEKGTKRGKIGFHRDLKKDERNHESKKILPNKCPEFSIEKEEVWEGTG